MTLLDGSRPGRWATLIGGGFAVGSSFGFITGTASSSSVSAVVAVIGVSLVAGALRRRLAVPLATVGLAMTLGLLRGSLAVVTTGPATIDGNFGMRLVVLAGTVRSADPGGSNAIVDTTHISDADSDRAISGGVLVSGPLVPALSPGDRVEIDASGLRPLNRRPGAESEQTLEREGVAGLAVSPQVFVLAPGGPSVAGVVAWAQSQLVASVDGEVSEPSAALLLGVAFGIHQPLTAAVRTPLQDAGLIHIVVVSGLKIVLVMGLMRAVARALQLSRRQTLLMVVPIVLLYVLISGAGPAAIRSAVMAGTALLFASGGRRPAALPMLALVAAAMLALAPGLVVDPGFQLSFLGTAGILVLAAPIARRLPGPRLFAEPFSVTVAAQVATVPVMAGTFGVIALGGPIANALVLPLLPIMIVTGGAGAILSALHPGLGWILLQGTALGASTITAVSRLVTAIPGAALQIRNWPAAWSAAEATGVLTALIVVAQASRRQSVTSS